MLSDKQSLILCGVIIGSFILGGIFDILDSYVSLGFLLLALLLLILNIGKVKSNKDKDSKQ